jgi:Zn-dependent metalloprotease
MHQRKCKTVVGGVLLHLAVFAHVGCDPFDEATSVAISPATVGAIEEWDPGTSEVPPVDPEVVTTWAVQAPRATPLSEKEKAQVLDEAQKRTLQIVVPDILMRMPRAFDALQVRDSDMDTQGDVHVKLDAYRFGLRVVGAEIVHHELTPGKPTSTDLLPDMEGVSFDDAESRWSSDGAAAAAAEALRSELHAPVQVLDSEQVYERFGYVYRRVWRVNLNAGFSRFETEWAVLLDAASGRVLERYDTTQYGTGISANYPVKTATAPAGGRPISMESFLDGDDFVLKDVVRPAQGKPPIHVKSALDNFGTSLGCSMGVDFATPDDTFGNGQQMLNPDDSSVGPLSPTGRTAGGDAQFSAGWAWDLYKQFNRSGPYQDGSGLDICVHTEHAGASYNHTQRRIQVGRSGISGCSAAATSIPTIAHEMGHAFLQKTVQLNISLGGESGGVREAVGDIMGKITEAYAYSDLGIQPDVGTLPPPPSAPAFLPTYWPHWDVRACGQVARSMWYPAYTPGSPNEASDTIESTNMEEHRAAGPINRMFYFLAAGVQSSSGADDRAKSTYLPQGMPGVGLPVAADIFFRAVANYLTGTNPKFINLRNAMVEAARNTASPDAASYRRAVEDAFGAVGVGAIADRDPPTIGLVSPDPIIPGRKASVRVTDASNVATVTLSSFVPGAWGIATKSATMPDMYDITVPNNVILHGSIGDVSVMVCADDEWGNTECQPQDVHVDESGPAIKRFGEKSFSDGGFTRIWAFEVETPTSHISNFVVDVLKKSSNSLLPDVVVYSKNHSFPSPSTISAYSTDALSINLLNGILGNIPEGLYIVRVTVWDTEGRASAVHSLLLFDHTPPTCRFNPLPAYAYDWDSLLTTNVFGQGMDTRSGLDTLTLTLDGVTIAHARHYGPPKWVPGPTFYSVKANGFGGRNWSRGTHTLQLTCKDRAKNVSTVTREVAFGWKPQGKVELTSQSGPSPRKATLRLWAAEPGAGLRDIYGTMNCTQSGTHNIYVNLMSTWPNLYDQEHTFPASGSLSHNENCVVSLKARSAYGIESAPFTTAFVQRDPASPPPEMVFFEHEPNNVACGASICLNNVSLSYDVIRGGLSCGSTGDAIDAFSIFGTPGKRICVAAARTSGALNVDVSVQYIPNVWNPQDVWVYPPLEQSRSSITSTSWRCVTPISADTAPLFFIDAELGPNSCSGSVGYDILVKFE